MFDREQEYSDNALAMYKKLYFNKNETAIKQVHKRVAATIAVTQDEFITFEKLLNNGYFRPNSPCLINSNPHNNPHFDKLGLNIDSFNLENHKNPYCGNLAACFVVGLDDSMDSIIDMWRICASVYAGGGGVGIPLSNLREKNAPIASGGVASGPITYLKVVQSISDTVKSGGKTRRAANLTSFKVTHPDILEYIECKEHNNLSAVNISVLVPDWFMEAVDNKNFDKEVDLISPNGNRKVGKLTVGKIWNAIIEHAHKTGDPGVLFYDESNRKNAFPSKGEILSTNPCIPAWGLVLTPNGYRYLKDFDRSIILDDKKYKCSNLIKTSNSSMVFEVVTESGYTAYMTGNHKVSTPNGDIELEKLKVGDYVVCQINNILGKVNNKQFIKGFEQVSELNPNDLFNIKSNISYQLGCIFKEFFNEQALFVNTTSYEIELMNQNDLKLIQLILSSVGIRSTYNLNKLVINDNTEFNNLISKCIKSIDVSSFSQVWIKEITNLHKDENYELKCYEFTDRIVNISKLGNMEVYDIKVPGINHFITSGMIVHNCGEVTLPDFSMCNLGSINLLKFVNEEKCSFDMDEFKECIKYAVSFLDNVIDTTEYPHPKFKERMKSERPIGLGIMGLSQLFYKLKIRYGSQESLKLFEDICKTLTLTAIRQSIKRAELYNPIEIPKEDTEHFIERLKSYGCTKDDISEFVKHGIRNSTWTSIAPTGCVRGDTLILTDEGLLSVFEIYNSKSGTDVVKIISNKNWDNTEELYASQPDGKLNLINSVYYNSIGKTRIIKTEYGYELCGTPEEHRIKVVSDSKYDWKYLNEITESDLIPITFGQHWKVINHNHPYQKLDFTQFPVLDQKIAYIFGYIISNVRDRTDTEFVLTIDESQEYKSIINTLLNELLSIKAEEINDGTITYIKYKLSDLNINDISLDNLNLILRKSPSLVILAFLQGLYFGQLNNISSLGKQNTLFIDNNPTNLLLIQQLYVSLGFITKIINNELNMVYDKNVISIPEMFCYLPDDEELISRIKESITNETKILDANVENLPNDTILCRITSISDEEFGGLTFDINVPETETYLANGFISHNSISISADSSYAFEPEMAIIWSKNIVDTNDVWYFVNKDFEKACKEYNIELNDDLKNQISANKGSIQDIDHIPQELKDVFVTAFDVGWKKKIEMQAVGQKYISLAISSTCNLPNEATFKDVSEAYLLAWKNHLKGITIYRDGSLSFQPVNFGGSDKKKEDVDTAEISTCKKMERPIVRIGKTVEIKTPHGHLYLTGNVNKDGKIFELFLNMGKQGELINLLLNAFSRIFSKALQYNVPIEDLTNTIRHTNGVGFFIKLSDDDEKSEFAESIIDAIGLILETHFNNKKQSIEMDEFIKRAEVTIVGDLCPECGQYTLTHTSGCRGGSCSSCGYSACQ